MEDDDNREEIVSLTKALRATDNFETAWAPMVISDRLNEKVEGVLERLQRERDRTRIIESPVFSEEPFNMTIDGYKSIISSDRPGRLGQLYWYTKDTGYEVIIKTDDNSEIFSWSTLQTISTQDNNITAMRPSGRPNYYVVRFVSGGVGGGIRWAWEENMEIGVSSDKEINLEDINYNYVIRRKITM